MVGAPRHVFELPAGLDQQLDRVLRVVELGVRDWPAAVDRVEVEASTSRIGAPALDDYGGSDRLHGSLCCADSVVRHVSEVPAISANRGDAAELLDRRGGVGEMPNMYSLLVEVVAARPNARTITTVDGQIDQAYSDLLSALAVPPRSVL